MHSNKKIVPKNKEERLRMGMESGKSASKMIK
jgi:hypothetical protein